MTKIKKIQGLEILDSRGNPTIACELMTESGAKGYAPVPSGASTGEHEAVEMRDNDPKRYGGKGVKKATDAIDKVLGPALIGMEVSHQKEIDRKMIELDGTENKSKFGANAILGISLAAAKAAAQEMNIELFEYLSPGPYSLPTPMMNIVNGGAHADNTIDFQEFMIRPISMERFSEKIRAGSEIFHTLKKILQKKGMVTAVGDEGGFAPNLKSNEEALDIIIEAIEKSGYAPGKDITIALDPAASFFYQDGNYLVAKKTGSKEVRSSDEQVAYLEKLVKNYPIDSIEDGLDENDWQGWKLLTERLGSSIQIVGDDLFVTNPQFLKRGIEEKSANAILIKLNQIGTVTETLETIELAQKNNFHTVISHRSGETEDTFIADLAVAVNSGQIKTGSLCRSDRTAKYNRLLYIEKLG